MLVYEETFSAATRHLHQLQCSKRNVKKIAFDDKEPLRIRKLDSRFYETLRKQ